MALSKYFLLEFLADIRQGNSVGLLQGADLANFAKLSTFLQNNEEAMSFNQIQGILCEICHRRSDCVCTNQLNEGKQASKPSFDRVSELDDLKNIAREHGLTLVRTRKSGKSIYKLFDSQGNRVSPKDIVGNARIFSRFNSLVQAVKKTRKTECKGLQGKHQLQEMSDLSVSRKWVKENSSYEIKGIRRLPNAKSPVKRPKRDTVTRKV